MTPLSVVTWRWGTMFSVDYVNRLQSMLAKHLHLPHTLFCVTDDPRGLASGIVPIAMPLALSNTIRCRRRLWQYDRARIDLFGPRMLCLDLDLVITGDITPLMRRGDPLVCWRAHYANAFSPALALMDTGVLDGLWRKYDADPDGYPEATGHVQASDLAMLNHFLRGRQQPPYWDEQDGVLAYFGEGYAHLEHHGIGPSRPELPPGTRIVLFGGADKAVLDEGRYPWVVKHWGSPLLSAEPA